MDRDLGLSRTATERALEIEALPENIRFARETAFKHLAEHRDLQQKSVTTLIVVTIGIGLLNLATLKDIELGPFRFADLSFFRSTS
jgi:hypothetical protein